MPLGCIVPSCEEKVGAADISTGRNVYIPACVSNAYKTIPTEVETRTRRVSLCAELSMGALMGYQWAFVAVRVQEAAVDCHAHLVLGPFTRKVSGRSTVNP